jgi:WXXGXW repeat (2 copies)
VKPQGDNVQWIAGYWAWDTDRQDFLWVSGFWRVPPPDRKWVPGYWNQVEQGWQWVPGFWAPIDQKEVPYLPEAPPDSLDSGPSVPPPNDNSTYVPGCWVYRDTEYLWRAGYWIEAQPDYAWIAAHYCATPSGYVFVDGYWDYPLEDRGLLFAPVVFNQPLWQNSAWSFQPDSCLDTSNLLTSLFVRPGWSCYYFGDYAGSAYRRAGYRPWARYGARHHDSLFEYYRWAHRHDRSWYSGLVNASRGGRGAGHLVRPLAEVRNSSAFHLGRASQAAVDHARENGRLYHESALQRARWEGQHSGRVGRGTALPLSHLPVVARHSGPAPVPPRRSNDVHPARPTGPGVTPRTPQATPREPAGPRRAPTVRQPARQPAPPHVRVNHPASPRPTVRQSARQPTPPRGKVNRPASPRPAARPQPVRRPPPVAHPAPRPAAHPPRSVPAHNGARHHR